MSEDFWKPTIRIRLTSPQTIASQTALFETGSQDAPPCDHRGTGREDQRNLITGEWENVCAECFAVLPENDRDRCEECDRSNGPHYRGPCIH